MNVSQQVKFDMYVDAANTERSAAFDSALVESLMTEHSTGVVKVAGGGGSEALPFGGIDTARIVYVRTDKEVTLTFNGGAEPMTLRPTGGTAALYAIFLASGTFTAIQVDNAGDDPATVLYALAGE